MYESLFYDKQVNHLFSDTSTLHYLFQFEIALAQAQALQGIIPTAAAEAIESVCVVENIDMHQLILDVRLGANTPIPLVKQLTTHLKQQNTEGSKFIHFGATSQDVVDTATMLQVRDAVQIIHKNVAILCQQLVFLIENHRNTLMIGRSFMQQAKPITFGFKVATWLDGLLRSKQLGGAVGNLSSMPDKGFAVMQSMSDILNLKTPSVSWHTQRDRFVEIATSLGILVGTISKIAKDISLMMQTEIAEVFEPSGAGKGGSSTMPHKRNPVSCIAVLAVAQRMPPLVSTMLASMTQDHERATGAWHAEWEVLADIVKLSGGAVAQAVEMTNGLEVNTHQMLKNMDCTEGLIFAENVSLALSAKIGKAAAHHLVEAACKMCISTKKHLKLVLKADEIVAANLSTTALDACFDANNSLGLCQIFIDNVLKNEIEA
jgi:3-carboxy-cis,cis-muconate cycloisomerase